MPSDDEARREREAWIDRELAETRKLFAESDKFVTEQRKLMAEAQKFEREHWWYPFLQLITVAVSSATVAAIVARLIR
jgi:hypothetical protein